MDKNFFFLLENTKKTHFLANLDHFIQKLNVDHLIHCRWNFAQSKQPLQLHDVEVGHAYAFDLP